MHLTTILSITLVWQSTLAQLNLHERTQKNRGAARHYLHKGNRPVLGYELIGIPNATTSSSVLSSSSGNNLGSSTLISSSLSTVFSASSSDSAIITSSSVPSSPSFESSLPSGPVFMSTDSTASVSTTLEFFSARTNYSGTATAAFSPDVSGFCLANTISTVTATTTSTIYVTASGSDPSTFLFLSNSPVAATSSRGPYYSSATAYSGMVTKTKTYTKINTRTTISASFTSFSNTTTPGSPTSHSSNATRLGSAPGTGFMTSLVPVSTALPSGFTASNTSASSIQTAVPSIPAIFTNSSVVASSTFAPSTQTIASSISSSNIADSSIAASSTLKFSTISSTSSVPSISTSVSTKSTLLTSRTPETSTATSLTVTTDSAIMRIMVSAKTTMVTAVPSSTPKPAAPLCGLQGEPNGDNFLAEYRYITNNVPVTQHYCYKLCASEFWGTCQSYEFFPEPGTLAPRCALYSTNVANSLSSVNDYIPNFWYDLGCGDPTPS